MTTATKKKLVKTHLNLRSFRRVLKLIKDSEAYVAIHPEAASVFDYHLWASGVSFESKTPKQILKHPCGTQCCIGGWGNVLRNADENKRRLQTNEVAAAEFFRMTCLPAYKGASYAEVTTHSGDWKDNEAHYLFYGEWHRQGTSADTKDVIAKLENIIKTGKVVNPRFDKKYLHEKV